MDLGLKDKYVVVTGAANGLGTAVSLALLEEGAQVIAIDKEPLAGSELERKVSPSVSLLSERGEVVQWESVYYREPLGRAVEKYQWRHDEARKLFDEVIYAQADASDPLRMQEVFSSLPPAIYGLVNNAGLLGGDDAHGGRLQLDNPDLKPLDPWYKMIDAHATGAHVATELAVPRMREGGAIVNIGSIELDMCAPGVVLYAAAKGALLGMTIAYAVELAPNIRVNMVSPGNINTERNKAQYVKVPDLIAGFEGRTPLQRSLEPEEVARQVVGLLSPALSSAVTGQVCRVDGGYTVALWDPKWAPAGVYKKDVPAEKDESKAENQGPEAT